MGTPMPAEPLMLCLLAGAILGCTSKAPEASVDQRAAVVLPAEAAAAVRAEMRTMLGSLNAVLIAVAGSDTATIREAAQASGLAAAADPALEPLLPAPFLVLATATHRQFDSLALAASAGISADSVIRRLGTLTANCVACHAAFRLATPPAR
jgi:hypothetical protein